MEKYSVFYMTYFWTGIIHFSSEEEILQNLEEIELPADLWECNDSLFTQEKLSGQVMAKIEAGPESGVTFIYQDSPQFLKHILHIQRNF